MVDNANIAVELQNISFGYADGSVVLEGLDLVVNRGEVVFLEGRNGAGKSTLMNLIAKVLKPQEGSVQINCQRLEYLQQDYVRSLFPWHNVAWNICLPLLTSWRMRRKEILDKAQELCHEMGVCLRLNDHPYNFSGGQKHLITLLRAFAASPDLLLLDEPATGLDYVNLQKFWSTLVKYKARNPGLTVVCATHQMPDSLPLSSKRLSLIGHPPILELNPDEELFRCEEQVSAK